MPKTWSPNNDATDDVMARTAGPSIDLDLVLSKANADWIQQVSPGNLVLGKTKGSSCQ